MKFCTECGAPKPSETAKFCGECGVAFVQSAASRPNSELTEAELRAKAEAGDAEGLKELGVRAYQAGDLKSALEWYSKAAALGHAGAMKNLGLLAEEAGDKKAAIGWFTTSLEAGNLEASVALGNLYLRDRKFDQARNAYLVGAEQGDPAAMFSLSVVGMHRGDPTEGIDWLRKASKSGFARASLALAERAEAKGDLVMQLYHWGEAAAQGSTTACLCLANHAMEYAPEEALRWAETGLAKNKSDAPDPEAETDSFLLILVLTLEELEKYSDAIATLSNLRQRGNLDQSELDDILDRLEGELVEFEESPIESE